MLKELNDNSPLKPTRKTRGYHYIMRLGYTLNVVVPIGDAADAKAMNLRTGTLMSGRSDNYLRHHLLIFPEFFGRR